MSNPRNLIWAAAPALLLFLTACPSPVPAPADPPRAGGSVVLNLATPSRSVTADWSALIATYEVTLTSQDGFSAVTGSGPGPSVTLTGVRVGTWNVAVAAKDSFGVVVARASVLGQALPSATPINLTVKPSTAGAGDFSFAVRFPVLATPIDSIQAQLLEPDGTPYRSLSTQTSFVDLGGGLLEAVFAEADLPSAPYRLALAFYQGATVARYLTEAVNVWDDVDSNLWVAPDGSFAGFRQLAAADFKDDNADLDTLTIEIDGALSAFVFDPLDADQTVAMESTALTQALTFTPSQALPGQRIEYSLGGAYQDLASGTTSGLVTVVQNGGQTLALRVTAPNRQTQTTYLLHLEKTVLVATVTIVAVDGTTLASNQAVRIASDLAPASADNTAVAFTSSNEAVATVVWDVGTTHYWVYAHAVGTATITATSIDGPSASQVFTVTPAFWELQTKQRGSWSAEAGVPAAAVSVAGNADLLYLLLDDGSVQLLQSGRAIPYTTVPSTYRLLALAPDGTLYAGEPTTGAVLRFNGVWEPAAAALTGLTGLAVDRWGQLFASDGSTLRLWSQGRWNTLGSLPAGFRSLGGGEGVYAVSGPDWTAAGSLATWQSTRWLTTDTVPAGTLAVTAWGGVPKILRAH